jgi:NitT/TauT family transport system substrate-binding protein
MRRTTFLLAGAALTLAPRRARSQERDRLRIASSPDEDITAVLWGRESGIFQKANLDVDIQRSNNGSAVAAAVIGGSIDVGKSSMMSLVAAHTKAIPFVVVAAAAVYNGDLDETGLLVARDSKVVTVRDLNGKTLSCAALHDQFSIAIAAFVDQHGGDSSTLKFVELPNAAASDAIASGRVEAGMVANPFYTQAMASGKFRNLGHPFDAIARHFVSAGFFCTSDFLAKNRELIDRFRRSVYTAAAYVNGHPVETVGVLARFSDMDPKVIAAMTRSQLGTSLDPKLVQPLIDRAVAYKSVPQNFDCREMLDPGALR